MTYNSKYNKVVLITGSSRGIGASLATYFAKNKYSTVINYSNSKNDAENLYDSISKIVDKKYLLLCSTIILLICFFPELKSQKSKAKKQKQKLDA